MTDKLQAIRNKAKDSADEICTNKGNLEIIMTERIHVAIIGFAASGITTMSLKLCHAEILSEQI